MRNGYQGNAANSPLSFRLSESFGRVTSGLALMTLPVRDGRARFFGEPVTGQVTALIAGYLRG